MNLKKYIPLMLLGTLVMAACHDDESKNWTDYADWREANDEWLREQVLSGKYEKITPDWNEELSVYMRYLNNRELTEGNLTPLYTSTVAVKYKGWLYDGTPFDSSYVALDSVVNLKPSNLIDGWVIALEQMRVGDKVELIVPYNAAYGTASYGSVNPFSNLRFELELRDIPAYEIK